MASTTGTIKGRILLQFEGGEVREVIVTVVVPPGQSGGKSSVRPAGEECTPNELLPAVNLQGGTLSFSAGWPVNIDVAVVDNCGDTFTRGNVEARISGQEYVKLFPLGDGRWNGGWTLDGTSADVVLTVRATSESGWRGQREISLQQLERQGKPYFPRRGVALINAGTTGQPLAPGGLIEIKGDDLAESDVDRSTAESWSTSPVGGTQVYIGDKPIAIGRASKGQIVGQIPFDIEPDTPWRVYLRRGIALSSAVDVNVASAQPVIVTVPRTVQRRQKIEFTCTGLGALDVPVSLGDGAAVARPKFQPSVTVGGVAASEVSAVYEGRVFKVTATVPDITTGSDVPVVIRVDTGYQKVSSDPVSLEVR